MSRLRVEKDITPITCFIGQVIGVNPVIGNAVGWLPGFLGIMGDFGQEFTPDVTAGKYSMVCQQLGRKSSAFKGLSGFVFVEVMIYAG